MEEIFHAFGVDARLIVIQIFNFGLLLLALWYFLYTPVLKLLNERQEKIKQGVKDAEAAEQSLKEAGDSKAAIVAEAHNKADAIVKHAEGHANERKSEIVKEAEARAESVLESAEKRGEQIKHKITSEAEADIAKAAVLAAEKILTEKA